MLVVGTTIELKFASSNEPHNHSLHGRPWARRFQPLSSPEFHCYFGMSRCPRRVSSKPLCIMDFRLHHDPSALKSTNYFEFLPRRYEGKLWNDDSVYLYHEVVHLFDDILEQHIPEYWHFSFTEATATQAHSVADDLKSFADRTDASRMPHDIGLSGRHAERLADDWPSERKRLASSLRQLASWIKEEVSEDSVLWVLGM
jgi:hypothetical protein